ncbi:MAG: endonuclease/exonuclease/phosphatase family protein [Actinomycetota bacterium]
MSSISIASFNIQYSLGADNKYDLKRSIDTVRDADIICLQEIDRNWRRTNMADQFAEIQALLPDRYAVFGPWLDVDASAVNPDGSIKNRRRQGGQMTISRYPIASSRVIHLPKLDTGPTMNMWSAFVESVVLTPTPVRVINLHLSDSSESSRIDEISYLIEQCNSATLEGGAWNGEAWDAESMEHWQLNDPVPPMPEAVILAGDFNAEPDSPVIEKVINAGFRDTWRPEGAASPGVTFKTNPDQGTYSDMRIDFIFVSTHFDVVDSSIDEKTGASDHQPVWASLKVNK